MAKLVERRELEQANIRAEVNLKKNPLLKRIKIYLRFYFSQETKLDRELNVELMDMGMRVAHDMDPKVI